MLEMTNPAALPSKLARSRSFRPKPIRPLKENHSEPEKCDTEMVDTGIPNLEALKDPMNAAGYRVVTWNNNKLILHGTDPKTLDEAKEVLNSHFQKKMLDQML